MAKPEAVTSLYLHIPFCERKCEYCDFVSVAGTKLELPYVKALAGELEMLAPKLGAQTFATVFLGGGTPGLLDPENLACLLDAVREHFLIAIDAEVTVEANPSSITKSKAIRWREAGVNRVSIGVQSLDDQVLKFLGRVHDAHRAVDAVAEVMAAGITNINCDLIYGIPDMSDETWRNSLVGVAALSPKHISCYELTVESGTPLAKSVEIGRVTMPSDDIALAQHWIAVDFLSELGFEQYEISNFAKADFACRHNLNYWRAGYYVAAGVGAHGHLPPSLGQQLTGVVSENAVRYWNVRGIARYIERVGQGELPTDGWESIDDLERKREQIMLQLRLATGLTVEPSMSSLVETMVDAGLLTRDQDTVRATRRGQEVLSAVTRELAKFAATPV